RTTESLRHDQAARPHQRPNDEKGDRRDIGSGPDRRGEAVDDPASGHPAAPAEGEDRREKDSERDQPEADQLGMLRVLRLALTLLRTNARRQAWFEGAFRLTTRRHARLLRRRGSASYAMWLVNASRAEPRRPEAKALRSSLRRRRTDAGAAA